MTTSNKVSDDNKTLNSCEDTVLQNKLVTDVVEDREA